MARRVLPALAASACLAVFACGERPTPPAAPATSASTSSPDPQAEPRTKKDCDYCSLQSYRGEVRCMDAQDGPCGDERVGSCMHYTPCEARCCADAGAGRAASH
jgi:hypothetical protein